MANITVEHYAAAVVILGKRLLLVRELGKDDFPITGFYFPGGKAKNEDQLKQSLLDALQKKYCAKVKIVETVTPLARIEKGKKVVIHGFLCEPLTNFVFPKSHFQFVYSGFDELSSLYIDPLDRKLAEKIAHFYPVYCGKKRFIKLTEKENAEAAFYLESLFYFRSAVSAKEIADFSLLIRADSTIGQIRSAYTWLLDLHGLDVNQYLDIVEYKKAHSKQ